MDSVLFDLSNISQMIDDIGQETAQHLSHDVMFVVSDRMTQTKNFFCGRASVLCCALNLEQMLLVGINYIISKSKFMLTCSLRT